MPRLSRRRLSSVALAVLAVSALLYLAGPAFTTFTVPVDTTTRRTPTHGWTVGGSDSFQGELLDSTQYITSWLDNGDSEKLVAQAKVDDLGFGNALPFGCRYLWSVNTGLGWGSLDPPIQEVACDADLFRTPGFHFAVAERTLHQPLVGGVRVEFQLFIGWDLIFRHDYEWRTVVKDEARLLPGVGDVFFDRPNYAVGQTAEIRVCVGYASSTREGGDWRVELFGPETDSWDFPDNVCTPSPSAVRQHTFQTPGQYRVELRNTIVGVKDDDAAVVDDLDLAPRLLFVKVEPPGTRSVGDSMTVTITAEPNPSTGLPIEAYYFHVRQGPSTIIVDRWQPSHVFEFTIQNDGDVQVNVGVRDGERMTFSDRIDVQVEGSDKPWGSFPGAAAVVPWWIWLAVGFLLAGALGVQFLPQVPQGGRSILSVFFLGAVGVLLLLYIVFPAVDAWIRGLVLGV